MSVLRRKKGNGMFVRFIGGTIAIAVAAVVVQSIPDIARYLKIRAM